MKALIIGLLTLGLAACGSSAEPTYYALASRPGSAQTGAPKLLELRRPGLAGYLDRAQIVRRVVDYKLNIPNGERWAEPLGDMVGRVFAQDLAARLPESSVFVENGAIAAAADAVVAIDIVRFDSDADGTVHLDAQVAIETTGDAKVMKARRIKLEARPEGDGTPALVAAMSGLLATLSDTVAQMARDQGKLNGG